MLSVEINTVQAQVVLATLSNLKPTVRGPMDLRHPPYVAAAAATGASALLAMS